MAAEKLGAHHWPMPSRQEAIEIAARLKAARMAINPNQSEFARRAGLTQNRYNQYETAERPLTLDAALKLRDTYGLTLDYLFRGDAALVPYGLMERLANHRR